MIEVYKGKTTIMEFLEMDIGTIDYMYYKLYLKNQSKQGRESIKNEQVQDAFEELGGL